MHPLSTYDLLRVWEVGEDLHPLDRALTLLAAASPELTWDELAELSIGQRDARLLTLREQTWGSTLSSFAECPLCAERLEFELSVADLRVAEEPDGEQGARELTMDGLVLRFRRPNSRDLAAVSGCQHSSEARDEMVRRCVLQANRDEAPVAVGELPAEVISELAQQMAACDPQAEVPLDLRCPTCDHRWQVPFDILAFFWVELAAQAKLLLREIHVLARAYGWREKDILGMSARRRQSYLEMVT